MDKRISARGIIIDNDEAILMYREKQYKHERAKYYVIPGGGVENHETLEECVIRELKEELSVTVKINGYLGKKDNQYSEAHYYDCSIASGKLTLGGEEALKNSLNNYYEIKRIPVSEIFHLKDFKDDDVVLKAKHKMYMKRK